MMSALDSPTQLQFETVLRALDELQPAADDAGTFCRACEISAVALQIVTVLAIEILPTTQRVLGWSAPGLPPYRRASAEARAWSFLTLASAQRDGRGSAAVHFLEPSLRYVRIPLPAEDAMAEWLVQFEGLSPFDRESGELLRLFATKLRELCAESPKFVLRHDR